ncbi:MAG: pyridoxal phosphate-dependent aminotransferase family protein [Planctomycetaceae bacterium]|nr:pyridoxal phosphate-dependent aminotransferase family protein [Planctomycetaceae bacterium]
MFSPACPFTPEESLSLDGPPDVMVSITGRTFQYHQGSGYYSLQSHPEVLAAACQATLRYGISSGISRNTLTAPPVFDVERKAAAVLGMNRAYYCSTELSTNRTLLETLLGTFDHIFIDEAANRSLFDAIKILKGITTPPVRFAHRDANDLKTQLDKTLRPKQRPLVLTDGVFFSHGTIAPLDEYDVVLAEYGDAAVFVDDSHGFGILGGYARGTLEFFDFPPRRANRTLQVSEGLLSDSAFFSPSKSIMPQTPVRYYFSAMLGHAVGGYGGVLPGSETFVQRIIERSIDESEPPPTPMVAATVKGLELVFEQTDLRSHLKNNSQLLRKKLRGLGIEVGETPLPIVTFQLGSSYNMRRIQRTLAREGILISYFPRLPGLGPDGTLHLTVFATHTPEHLDRLAEALKNEL